MIAVLTGDIINSRTGNIEAWMPSLKKVLNLYGDEFKDWEVFRGDSFQIAVKVEIAMIVAFHIKSVIKQSKQHDVRIAIGIGEKTYASTISESNGSAYIRSGESFESMKKQTLTFKCGNEELNQIFTTMIPLAMLVANGWSSTVAEFISASIEHNEMNQKELAELLQKSQSTISEALKRGGFDEIMNMNSYYESQISKL